MHSETKKLSPVLFGIALLGYFLPFVTVSCQGQKVASFTGTELVFGTTVQEPQMFGPPKAHRIDAEPLAVLAFLCCLAGFGLGFAKSRNSEIGTAAVAGVGFIALLLLRSKLENQALRQSSGAFQVVYEFGFWLVVLLSVAAGVLSAVAPWRSQQISPAIEHRTSSDAAAAQTLHSLQGESVTPAARSREVPAPPTVSEPGRCPKCSTVNPIGTRFCENCGSALPG